MQNLIATYKKAFWNISILSGQAIDAGSLCSSIQETESSVFKVKIEV